MPLLLFVLAPRCCSALSSTVYGRTRHGVRAGSPRSLQNKTRLFVISVIALLTAGISLSMRASVATALRATFFDPINPTHSAEMIATVLGVLSLGFAITIAVGSPLCDYIGMEPLLALSSLCFIEGTLIVDFAARLSRPDSVYWVLWAGVAVIGIGWGLVETVISPLTATLYPEEKTAKLNILHAWWPFGLIAGGLIGLGLDALGLGWQIKLGVTLIPALTFLVLSLGTRFPPTERVASGVSAAQMFREMQRPMFLVWFFSMFLTAAIGTRAGPVGRYCAHPNGWHPRNLAVDIR